jgi:nucleoside-diphosphate-sugar epimerase
VRNKIGWEPKVSLEEGLEKTYKWIEKKVNEDREALASKQ